MAVWSKVRSGIKCSVMNQRSWVQTPVESNLNACGPSA